MLSRPEFSARETKVSYFVKSLLVALFFVGFVASLEAAPVKGGTFKWNLSSIPTVLNPLSSSEVVSTQVADYVMETLLTHNADTYEYEPALAKSWTKSKDGKTFTFTLRDDAKWSDGKPVTIEDVKFSFDAIVEPTNKYKTASKKPYYDKIATCKIIGKKTIEFKVKDTYFLNFNVAATLTVVPKHIYETPSKKLNKKLIGSGPYILKKFDRKKGITLVRNKNWWGNKAATTKDKYNFKKILIRFVKDKTIALQRHEKGEIDLLGLTAEEYVKKTSGKKWGKDVLKIKYDNKGPRSYGFVAFNMKNPLFKSREVRKAMAHLFNRELMIKKFLYGYALPATGPLFRQSPYANPKVKPIKFSPKVALKLLNKQGWKDTDGDRILDKVIDGKKTKLSFTLLNPAKSFEKYLTIFKQDAKKAGVEVNVKFIEWNTFIKKLDERSFEAVTLAWGGGDIYWDPKQIWHSDSIKNSGSNFVNYSNPIVDKLIDEARVTVNEKKRVKKLHAVYKMIADDVPYVFLFNSSAFFLGHTKKMKRVKDSYKYGLGKEFWWIQKN